MKTIIIGNVLRLNFLKADEIKKLSVEGKKEHINFIELVLENLRQEKESISKKVDCCKKNNNQLSEIESQFDEIFDYLHYVDNINN